MATSSATSAATIAAIIAASTATEMLGIALGRPVFEAVDASTEEPAATAIVKGVSVVITAAKVTIVEPATWLALSAAFACLLGPRAVVELCSIGNHLGSAPLMEAFPTALA